MVAAMTMTLCHAKSGSLLGALLFASAPSTVLSALNTAKLFHMDRLSDLELSSAGVVNEKLFRAIYQKRDTCLVDMSKELDDINAQLDRGEAEASQEAIVHHEHKIDILLKDVAAHYKDLSARKEALRERRKDYKWSVCCRNCDRSFLTNNLRHIAKIHQGKDRTPCCHSSPKRMDEFVIKPITQPMNLLFVTFRCNVALRQWVVKLLEIYNKRKCKHTKSIVVARSLQLTQEYFNRDESHRSLCYKYKEVPVKETQQNDDKATIQQQHETEQSEQSPNLEKQESCGQNQTNCDGPDDTVESESMMSAPENINYAYKKNPELTEDQANRLARMQFLSPDVDDHKITSSEYRKKIIGTKTVTQSPNA